VTGEQLYQLYVDAHHRQSCGVDDWSALLDCDQQIWNEMASRIQPLQADKAKTCKWKPHKVDYLTGLMEYHPQCPLPLDVGATAFLRLGYIGCPYCMHKIEVVS